MGCGGSKAAVTGAGAEETKQKAQPEVVAAQVQREPWVQSPPACCKELAREEVCKGAACCRVARAC
jgi:hypothetical protein